MQREEEEEELVLVEGRKGPPLVIREREGNMMIIPWDPGIPNKNTRIDIPPPPPL